MSETLIADIGATNSRFALVGPDGRPDKIIAFSDDGVDNVEAAITRYLQLTKAKPTDAVLGIAAAIDASGDEIVMTNRNWRISLDQLARRFKLRTIRAVNDFEAVAWSLLRLNANDVRPIGPARDVARGAKAVFGPGTGMGVAALVPVGDAWQAVASEGGHVSFGPASEAEEQVFARLRTQVERVSAETILSGPGLERLHKALHNTAKAPPTEVIVKYAKEGEEAESATLALFVKLLGRFAGDLALTFKARGGVYIAGGVAQHIGPLLDPHAFRTAFEAHPPYQKFLQQIPTMLITMGEPGLLGCAVISEGVKTKAS